MAAANAWVNYQAAFGLVVGVNLALVALPSLRQPQLDFESTRWKKTLDNYPPSHGSHASVRQEYVAFTKAARAIEKQSSVINAVCFVISIAAAVLLVMSTFLADESAITWLAASAMFIGALPSVAFFFLNVHVRAQINTFASSRRKFDEAA